MLITRKCYQDRLMGNQMMDAFFGGRGMRTGFHIVHPPILVVEFGMPPIFQNLFTSMEPTSRSSKNDTPRIELLGTMKPSMHSLE